jgi:HEAT repeat protein
VRAWVVAFGLAAALPFKVSADSASSSALEDLKSQDPARQERAKELLRTFRFKDIAHEMEEFASDPNPDLRALMAQSIGELGGPEAAKVLERLFHRESDTRVRRALLIQLAGLLPPEDAVDFFAAPALSDPNDELRFLSLNQLSLLDREPGPQKRLIRIFQKALKKDGNEENRRLALLSLREMGEHPAGADEALLAALQAPSVELRRRAAALLGGLRGQAAFEQMAAAARDPDAQVRANLCQSLGETGDPSAVPVLLSLASDKDPQVRKGAYAGLARFPDGQVNAAPFIQALQESDPAVRSLAAECLERSEGGADVQKALEAAAAEDSDPAVRFLAKKALASLSQKR